MVLPIYIYGHPVLKKKAHRLTEGEEDLAVLIQSMWETMYNAKGVGLAAPQIGKSLRLFIMDTLQLHKEDGVTENPGLKQVFINAHLVEQNGDDWTYEEGCLSIPKLVGDVDRPSTITLEYQDVRFKKHRKSFDGINARVIQHEYDHIEGKLFTDRLKPVKKRMLQRKLDQMKKKGVQADYKIFQKPI